MAHVSGEYSTEETPLPAYSQPGQGVVHHRSHHLCVALSSATAVESGGLGLAFLPGAVVRIAIAPAEAKLSLPSTFSAIVVQFVGTSRVDAPGGKGRRREGRTMADVIVEIPLEKGDSRTTWLAEIVIPAKADCVCEWLATEIAESTVPLPPSVNIAEEVSKRRGTGGSLVVDYRVKLTLVHRARFHADDVTSIPITIISSEQPALDGDFVYDADDIRNLGLRPWRTMLLEDPDTAVRVVSTRSVVNQVKLGVLAAQKSDDYIVLWQLAVTFKGSLKDQHPDFSALVLSSTWPSLSIGRRFRHRDTSSSLPLSRNLFTAVHAAALSNPPTVEETSDVDGFTSSCVVRFKGLLKVQKDAIPVSRTCDGDLEVMVIASLRRFVEKPVTSMVSMFPGNEDPPAYPSLDFYPLGINSEYVDFTPVERM